MTQQITISRRLLRTDAVVKQQGMPDVRIRAGESCIFTVDEEHEIVSITEVDPLPTASTQGGGGPGEEIKPK